MRHRQLNQQESTMIFQKYALFFAIIISCGLSHAQTTSIEKNNIYKSCFSACMVNQRNASGNEGIKETPFIFDSFCSCQCSRYAMRVSKDTLDKLTKLATQGKPVDQVPELKSITEKSTKICSSAITAE